MTYLEINNHERGTRETIETPFTMKEFISFHWGAWGMYYVGKSDPKTYVIYSKFENKHCYTVKRINKGDMKKCK